MEGTGHFPMCENTATFKEYLIPLLEKVRTAKSGKAKAAAGSRK